MIRYPLYTSPIEGRTPFEEYKDEANGEPDLTPIESQVQACYERYEDAVNNENVHTLIPCGFISPQKEKLIKLYSSDCDIAKKIRSHHDDFTSSVRRIYNNKCPYCVLSEPNTLEHILPKRKYPEYAVHVYNLIPCCSKCNSHKGEAVKDSETGLPHTINFYYHNPEEFEFLQVDCSLDLNNKPLFSYNIIFPPDADPTLTSIIINHFNRLHLIERYNDEVIHTYTAIEPMIKMLCCGKTLDEALSTILDYFHAASPSYGVNHHWSALFRCLTSSPQYHAYLNDFCNQG